MNFGGSAALLHDVLVGARRKAAVARLRADIAPRTVDNLLLADVDHHTGLHSVRAAESLRRAKSPAERHQDKKHNPR